MSNSNFTYPTDESARYILADLVNVTWTVNAPVISLFEECGTSQERLQDQVDNTHSYVWTASRRIFKESGCTFKLQPFTAEHEAYGNNLSSVVFGVAKRFTQDPAPTSYNFAPSPSPSRLMRSGNLLMTGPCINPACC